MVTRQTARVTANKPWGGNNLVEVDLLIEIFLVEEEVLKKNLVENELLKYFS